MTAASRCPRGVAVGSGVGVGVSVGVGVGCGVGVFVGADVGKGVGSCVAVGSGAGSRRSQATASGRKTTKLHTISCTTFLLVKPRCPHCLEAMVTPL